LFVFFAIVVTAFHESGFDRKYIEMKFSLALTTTAAAAVAVAAAVVAANPITPAKSAAEISKLMRHARPTANSPLGQRRGEEQYGMGADLLGYSLRFDSCQQYDDPDPDTILTAAVQRNVPSVTLRLVTFRFCPTDDCNDACNDNYFEYIIDLEDYLKETVAYQQELQEEMCDACQEQCINNTETNNWNEINREENEGEDEELDRRLQNIVVDCDVCYFECEMIANMIDNGYIDATEFVTCQKVYYNGENDALYAGPMCASNGSKIKIGVFTDEECNVLDPDKDVENYLMDEDGFGMKLSHLLLKTTYSSYCVSCKIPEEKNDDDDEFENVNDEEENEPEVLEICESLYGSAVEFIEEPGEIETEEIETEELNASIGGGAAETTGGQKFALIAALILGTAGLIITS
jgi:hypothetical protein